MGKYEGKTIESAGIKVKAVAGRYKNPDSSIISVRRLPSGAIKELPQIRIRNSKVRTLFTRVVAPGHPFTILRAAPPGPQVLEEARKCGVLKKTEEITTVDMMVGNYGGTAAMTAIACELVDGYFVPTGSTTDGLKRIKLRINQSKTFITVPGNLPKESDGHGGFNSLVSVVGGV
jgi:hypothetical protein